MPFDLDNAVTNSWSQVHRQSPESYSGESWRATLLRPDEIPRSREHFGLPSHHRVLHPCFLASISSSIELMDSMRIDVINDRSSPMALALTNVNCRSDDAKRAHRT